ncbi:MAG TPA: hypothetical protein VIK89_12005 [Cytophagaceae bacterium]
MKKKQTAKHIRFKYRLERFPLKHKLSADSGKNSEQKNQSIDKI